MEALITTENITEGREFNLDQLNKLRNLVSARYGIELISGESWNVGVYHAYFMSGNVANYIIEVS